MGSPRVAVRSVPVARNELAAGPNAAVEAPSEPVGEPNGPEAGPTGPEGEPTEAVGRTAQRWLLDHRAERIGLAAGPVADQMGSASQLSGTALSR